MAEWTRSTPWRQGSILDQETFREFATGRLDPSQRVDFAVIVSHDCDIAANPAIESIVEAIPGRFIDREDGSLTHAKEARRLHLGVTDVSSGKLRFAEFRATEKVQIPKESLAGYSPSSESSLAIKELQILRRWLAARYRRHAFSDEFEARFDRVEKKFREILKSSSTHLRAVLFDLRDSDPYATNSDGPYVLDIYLVYTSAPNAEESQKSAEITKARIDKAFMDKYKSSGQWEAIELGSCDILSDSALTYAQYLDLVEWRAEGLSLRSDPFGPMSEENS
jgi:hypothetical protein